MVSPIRENIFEYIERIHTTPEEYAKIINDETLKKEGLREEAQLESWIALGDYIPVLNRIWAEQDQQRRLGWLCAQESKGDAVLLLELVCAKDEEVFTSSDVNTELLRPQIERINVIMLKVFKCLHQSSFCMRLTTGESIKDLENLMSVANESLAQLAELKKKAASQKTSESLSEVFEFMKITQNVNSKIYLLSQLVIYRKKLNLSCTKIFNARCKAGPFLKSICSQEKEGKEFISRSEELASLEIQQAHPNARWIREALVASGFSEIEKFVV